MKKGATHSLKTYNKLRKKKKERKKEKKRKKESERGREKERRSQPLFRSFYTKISNGLVVMQIPSSTFPL